MPLIDRMSDIRSAAICSLLLGMLLTVRGATGQTIQLPAFQQRGVQTTVVVPDRGSLSLGGFSGARQSRLRFAPPFFGPLAPSRALSVSRGVGNMQIHVWVHDLQAMDAAILAEPSKAAARPKKGGRSTSLVSRKPKPLPQLPAGN